MKYEVQIVDKNGDPIKCNNFETEEEAIAWGKANGYYEVNDEETGELVATNRPES